MSSHSRAVAPHPIMGWALLACVLAAQSPALAQTSAFRAVCNNHGANLPEPVGDRDGHRLQIAEGNCLVQGGLLDGAVLTEQTFWEFDKGTGTMLSSQGIYRRPGAMATYTNTDGAMSFQSTDGRITGWTAGGKGRFAMASGSAASLSGKTYRWTARPTGPRSYVIEIVYEPGD